MHDWRLSSRLSQFRWISRGAVGWVFQASENLIFKYGNEDEGDDFVDGEPGSYAYEIKAFSSFEKHPEPSLYIPQSIFRTSEVNFLPRMKMSLHDRLWQNQALDGAKFVSVIRTEPIDKISLWTMEMTAAVAWLESIGLVHGDLRPTNVLLDEGDHIKLCDFDYSVPIGTRYIGQIVPWGC